MQAADHGFTEVLTLTFPAAKAFEAKRNAAYRGFAELVARAKGMGRLRPDFSTEDLVLLLMANAGVIAATADAAPDACKRRSKRRTLAALKKPVEKVNTPAVPVCARTPLSLTFGRGACLRRAQRQPRLFTHSGRPGRPEKVTQDARVLFAPPHLVAASLHARPCHRRARDAPGAVPPPPRLCLTTCFEQLARVD